MYSPDVFLGNFTLLLMVSISTRNLFLVFCHGDINRTHCLISFRSVLKCHFHGEVVSEKITWYPSSHLLCFIALHSTFHSLTLCVYLLLYLFIVYLTLLEHKLEESKHFVYFIHCYIPSKHNVTYSKSQ